jgi:cytochrome c oxidase subunit II
MKMALNRKVSAAALLAAAAGAIALSLLAVGNRTSVLVRRAYAVEQTPVIEIKASEFQFSPSKIILKKGEPVILRLSSTDRTHGLLLRALKIDKEIPAGQTIDIAVTPRSVGHYTGICNHYCGTGHGGMKLRLTVVE